MITPLTLGLALLTCFAWQPARQDAQALKASVNPTGDCRPKAAIAELDKSIELARKKLDECQQAANLFQFEYGDGLLQVDGNRQAIETLRAIIVKKAVEVDALKANYEAVHTVRPEDPPISNDLQNRVASNPRVCRIEERLRNAELDVIALSSSGDTVTAVRLEAAKAVRDALEQELRSTQAEVIVRLNTDLIEETRREYLNTLDTLCVAKDRLCLAEFEQLDLNAKKRKYDELVAQTDSARCEHDRLVEQRRMLETMPSLISALDSYREDAKKAGKNIEISVTWDLSQSAKGPNVTMKLATP